MSEWLAYGLPTAFMAEARVQSGTDCAHQRTTVVLPMKNLTTNMAQKMLVYTTDMLLLTTFHG